MPDLVGESVAALERRESGSRTDIFLAPQTRMLGRKYDAARVLAAFDERLQRREDMDPRARPGRRRLRPLERSGREDRAVKLFMV